MNKVLLSAVLAGATLFASTAFAEVTGISMKFAGGCSSTNTTGSCKIKALASGSDFSSDKLYLQKTSGGPRGNFVNVGRPRTPADNGYTEWRFKNDPSTSVCYRVKSYDSNIRSRMQCIK